MLILKTIEAKTLFYLELSQQINGYNCVLRDYHHYYDVLDELSMDTAECILAFRPSAKLN